MVSHPTPQSHLMQVCLNLIEFELCKDIQKYGFLQLINIKQVEFEVEVEVKSKGSDIGIYIDEL